jgi:hypothetical protein
MLPLKIGYMPDTHSGAASQPCSEILFSTFLDRRGQKIRGALDLRGDEGVSIGASLAQAG